MSEYSVDDVQAHFMRLANTEGDEYRSQRDLFNERAPEYVSILLFQLQVAKEAKQIDDSEYELLSSENSKLQAVYKAVGELVEGDGAISKLMKDVETAYKSTAHAQQQETCGRCGSPDLIEYDEDGFFYRCRTCQHEFISNDQAIRNRAYEGQQDTNTTKRGR